MITTSSLYVIQQPRNLSKFLKSYDWHDNASTLFLATGFIAVPRFPPVGLQIFPAWRHRDEAVAGILLCFPVLCAKQIPDRRL
jgi:hypothetical protein